jgi:hypothetical protein
LGARDDPTIRISKKFEAIEVIEAVEVIEAADVLMTGK